MLNETAMRIHEYIKNAIENNYPPTIREICKALDIKSTSTVHKYISILVDEGYIHKLDNHKRAIRLKNTGCTIRVPVIDKIIAGAAIILPENVTEYICFTTEHSYSASLFALKYNGESMVNAGILRGDLIIAEQTSRVENGGTAAAIVGGDDTSVKILRRENDGFRLYSENGGMGSVIDENVKIIGKIVGLQRYF